MIPWRRLSYVNDPLENFQKWQQFEILNNDNHYIEEERKKKKKKNSIDDEDLIPGVVFFSSQCDPKMASARLKILEPLINALKENDIRFASFGRCYHNEDLGTSLPQCSGLQR